jgi:UDP-N-acetylmuramoylalanine--D-glutamate ligase
VPGFEGRKVAVLGLGRSGQAAAAALAAGGADLLAWDDSEKTRTTVGGDLPLCDPAQIDWREVAALMLSPGIPHSFPAPHPAVDAARRAGVAIIGDIELLGRAQKAARFIGITGTNGKSTTTALIGHILRQTGKTAEIGGNLGPPALGLAPLDKGGTYVLELSSFQLELVTSLAFDIAVLLNITPDHLDRHGGMDGYVAAKRRIFARQQKAQTAVIGFDDDLSRVLADALAGGPRLVPISAERRVHGGVYVEDGWLIDDMAGAAQRVLDLRRAARLPGKHNWQNAAAAFAATRTLGIDTSTVIAGILSFAGLAHRQELVATIDGVAYVNDSKATNADATAKALACYDAIYWIAGGIAKEGGIASLAPFFPRIRHAFLIGKATEEFAATLDGRAKLSRCGELGRAVSAAREAALAARQPGAVMLLSPACASFDQFANFEERGDTFRRLVEALPGTHA